MNRVDRLLINLRAGSAHDIRRIKRKYIIGELGVQLGTQLFKKLLRLGVLIRLRNIICLLYTSDAADE